MYEDEMICSRKGGYMHEVEMIEVGRMGKCTRLKWSVA